MQTVFIVVSLACALGYFVLLERPASLPRTAVKTATFALLASFVATLIADRAFADKVALIALALALALSALGDFLLSLKDQQRFFLFGLASFLAAHLAYLVIFVPRMSTLEGWALAAAIVAIAAALAFVTWLVPKLGRMTVPVLAYFTVIMAMVVAAISMTEAPWYLGAGAVLFAVSDSLIAVRKFQRPFPGTNTAIWATYCAAQYLIVYALLTTPGLT